MSTIYVKRYSSTQSGAPGLTGQVDALATLLKTVLVTGFNTRPITDLTRINTVATAAASGHGYQIDDVITISGVANDTNWNGEWRVVTVATNSFTFTVPDTLTTPATGGTIESKRSPAGWSTEFTDTNKVVLRPNPVGAIGIMPYLDIDDNAPTNAKMARIRAYESMTGCGVGTDPSPTVAQQSWGISVAKSTTTDATGRVWTIFADQHFLYLFISWNPTYSTFYDPTIFGTFIWTISSDPAPVIIAGGYSTEATLHQGYNYFGQANSRSATQVGKYLIRRYDNTKSVGSGFLGDSVYLDLMGAGGMTSPNPTNNLNWFGQCAICDNGFIRGLLPGLLYPLHSLPYSQGQIIENIPGFSGKKFFVQNYRSYTGDGQVLIDITGPWRS